MKVVAYFRRNPDPTQAEAELAVQRREVTRWIEDEDGALVAEFTEEETGGKARPAFGRARKAAQVENAVLLVATTKAIGEAERFSPYSSANPRIVSLPDPEEEDRKAWSRSRSMVVYLRTAGGHDDVDLARQREAVSDLILPDFHTVLAAFIEAEPLASSDERPALEAALAMCRQSRARLVVGTTDAIGDGPPFEPTVADVPFEIATCAVDRWAEVIAAPSDAAAVPSDAAVSILIGEHQVRNRCPAYLVNRTGDDLHGVTVTRSGWTLGFGDLTQMQSSTRTIERIADGTGALVGSFELAFDADFTISWRVTARDGDGRTWAGTTTLDKGGPPRRPLPLTSWHPLDQADKSDAD
ncbi:recombinase family protein [Aureimonas ureilytica]|uniref:hypothetical protein n=1 Tax=Aureimonas ureilytica TaxID=401562 RepID=UPI00036BEC33|nr:hypothetical protein [Aureimonas ureilytica]